MLDTPNMRDNSKKQDGQSSSRQKGFDVAISTQKLTIERLRQQREQEAKYANEHGVPTTHDILRSADLSLPKVPVSTFIETAHDILRYLDLPQQTPYISGLYQKRPLTDTLRRRINEACTTGVEASQQEPRSTDRPLRGDAISDLGPDKTSDSALAEQYNFLLRSTHFQHLAKIANSEEKITLRITTSRDMNNTSYTHGACYSDHNHTIYIYHNRKDGTAKSVEEIREDILWEMHNASMRDQLKRSAEKFCTAKPDQNAPRKEKEIYLYKMAAYALACEWIEWTNIMEHALRCQAINADPNMGAGEQHLAEPFQAITQPDHPWHKFDGYLKTQIEGEHTTFYDPHAANPSWVGKHFLAIVEKRSPAKFKIMQNQVEDWLTRKTEKIKPPSNTPFYSHAIVKKAQQHAKVQPVKTGQILGPRVNISDEE